MNTKKRKIVGIICIVAGVTALLVVLFFIFFGSELFLNPKYDFEPEQSVNSSSSLDAVDSISIPGMESMTISADTKNVSVNLYNPQNNNCYFEISIILDDGNKEIYKSKLIKPGQQLYEIELEQKLDKGTYNATLHYSTYTTDGNYTPLNGANVPFKIIAK